jgi:hypothetical protein
VHHDWDDRPLHYADPVYDAHNGGERAAVKARVVIRHAQVLGDCTNYLDEVSLVVLYDLFVAL